MSNASENRSPSNDEIIDDLRAVTEDIGRPPTTREYGDEGRYNVATALYRFGGSWDDVLEAADLSGGKETTRGRYRMSDEVLLDDLRRVAEDLGHVPDTDDYIEHGGHSIASIVGYFGSYGDAIEEAGLDPDDLPTGGKPGRPPIPDGDLLADLARVAEKVDRTPRRVDYSIHGEYSTPVLMDRWDSIENAVEAAGIPHDDADGDGDGGDGGGGDPGGDVDADPADADGSTAEDEAAD